MSEADGSEADDNDIKPFDSSINPLIRKLNLTGESDEPITVSFEDISAAAYRIRNGVRRTPCEVKSYHLIISLDFDQA